MRFSKTGQDLSFCSPGLVNWHLLAAFGDGLKISIWQRVCLATAQGEGIGDGGGNGERVTEGRGYDKAKARVAEANDESCERQ
jgi:hypothetical protein